MYDYLKGKLIEKSPTHVVIDVGGIGFFVHISLTTYTQVKDWVDGKLFVSFQVREDARPCGFSEVFERKMFEALIAVSGIGPNTARMMLSSLAPEDLQSAILSSNVALLKSIKGIGPKTAQRIILELQDRLKKLGQGSEGVVDLSGSMQVSEEAVAALLMLGFQKGPVEKIVAEILRKQPGTRVEDVIKLALKSM